MDTAFEAQTLKPKVVHHPFVYLNNKYVPFSDALLPVTTQAFNYGTGVFEGIRAYLSEDKKSLNIFRLDEHISRFRKSSEILLLDSLPDNEQIKEIILNLLIKNDVTADCYIRPIAFKKNLLPGHGFGVKLSGVSSELSINTLNMPSRSELKGIRCTISKWQRISDNSIPVGAKITGGYINSALAMESANRAGFDDALMLNVHGNLAEATTSNVFIIKNGIIITPSLNSHILDGITRNTVIHLAKQELGINVEEREISPSEILRADECFLTGTGSEIVPVTQIDHINLNSTGRNSITSKVNELYMKTVRGNIKSLSNWLTPVY